MSDPFSAGALGGQQEAADASPPPSEPSESEQPAKFKAADPFAMAESFDAEQYQDSSASAQPVRQGDARSEAEEKEASSAAAWNEPDDASLDDILGDMFKTSTPGESEADVSDDTSQPLAHVETKSVPKSTVRETNRGDGDIDDFFDGAKTGFSSEMFATSSPPEEPSTDEAEEDFFFGDGPLFDSDSIDADTDEPPEMESSDDEDDFLMGNDQMFSSGNIEAAEAAGEEEPQGGFFDDNFFDDDEEEDLFGSDEDELFGGEEDEESASSADLDIETRGGDAATDGDQSMLGDPERAQQFSMTEDEEANVPGGGYFHPEEDESEPPDPAPSGSSPAVDLDPGGGMDMDAIAGDIPAAGDIGSQEGAARPSSPGAISAPQKSAAPASTSSRPSMRGSSPTQRSASSSPSTSSSRPPSSSPASGEGVVVPPAPPVSELVVDDQGSVLQTVANVALILLLTGVGFLGFVAWQNGGLLDFKALGPMTMAAFGQGEYTPDRAAPEITQTDSAAGAAEEEEEEITVEGIEQLYFPNKQGKSLFVLEGMVVNRGEEPIREVVVEGVVENGEGEVLATREVTAARTFGEEELLGVVDEETLADLHEKVLSEAKDLIIGPNQGAKFTLVFPGLNKKTGETDRMFEVEVSSFQTKSDRGEDTPSAPSPGGDDASGAQEKRGGEGQGDQKKQ